MLVTDPIGFDEGPAMQQPEDMGLMMPTPIWVVFYVTNRFLVNTHEKMGRFWRYHTVELNRKIPIVFRCRLTIGQYTLSKANYKLYLQGAKYKCGSMGRRRQPPRRRVPGHRAGQSALSGRTCR